MEVSTIFMLTRVRKEMGMDLMLRFKSKKPAVSDTNEILIDEALFEEVCLSIKFTFPLVVHLSNAHV